MITPKYPIGIAIQGAGGRKFKQDRHVRSARARRRAFEKRQTALIAAAWKRWGSVDAMPLEEQAKLDHEIARLREYYGGR